MSERSYSQSVLPGTGVFPLPAVWVSVCGLCGSVVMHRDLHDDWHADHTPRAEQGGES